MTAPQAPSFAERVASFDGPVRGFYHPVDTSAIISDLIACIRDQQVALISCLDALESQEIFKSKNIGFKVTYGCADNARAILAKYALEKP